MFHVKQIYNVSRETNLKVGDKLGNKDAGRAIARLDNISYQQAMGATITNYENTGVAFTNWEVFKYFKMFRNYALGRIKWTSPQISENELCLIEWNILNYGYCAMLRPKIKAGNSWFQINMPRIYQCSFLKTNHRTGYPFKISIVNNSSEFTAIEINYEADEFVIFTDEFLFPQNTTPFINVVWEYACKMHEIDLMFNANSHKLRMPLVFNSATIDNEKEFFFNNSTKGTTLAELMRSSYVRNEQFLEVPQNLVGNNFMHEPQHAQNLILEHLEAKKRLKQNFFEDLGLYTNHEKSGVYTIKDIQENGDETGDYIVETMKNVRKRSMLEACGKFNIDLVMEVI